MHEHGHECLLSPGILKDIQEFYSINNSQAGLLASSSIASFVIFSLLYGYLGDRFNRKYVMIVGLVSWSLIGFGSSFIGSQVSFSERELTFMFAVCYRPSVCLSVCLSSVTLVRPTQAVEIFGNISTAYGTMPIH